MKKPITSFLRKATILFLLVINQSYLQAQPGAIDPTFNVGSGADGSVYATSIQSDGKIIIGGGFTYYNGTSRNNIARLNTDGSLDNSFSQGTGASYYVYDISTQSDGKIIMLLLDLLPIYVS